MHRHDALTRRTFVGTTIATIAAATAGCTDTSPDGDGGGDDGMGDGTDANDDGAGDSGDGGSDGTDGNETDGGTDSDGNGTENGNETDGDADDGPEAGSVVVTVLDTEMEPIEGATVTLEGESLETDAEGEVTFEDVDFGEYTGEVEADGFESAEFDAIVREDVPESVLSVELSQAEG